MRSRTSASAAPALLLLSLLAALGCGNDGVPGNFALGTTPAPVAGVDAKGDDRVREPAAPPTEPSSSDVRAERAKSAVGGEGTGSGHLTLTGDYRLAEDTAVRCERFADFSQQVLNLDFIDSRSTLEVPRVQIAVLGDRIATGSLKGIVYVAITRPEGLVVSQGTAHVQLTVTPIAQPRRGSLVSGQLSGFFVGNAGEGDFTGRFDNCFVQGDPPPRARSGHSGYGG